MKDKNNCKTILNCSTKYIVHSVIVIIIQKLAYIIE